MHSTGKQWRSNTLLRPAPILRASVHHSTDRFRLNSKKPLRADLVCTERCRPTPGLGWVRMCPRASVYSSVTHLRNNGHLIQGIFSNRCHMRAAFVQSSCWHAVQSTCILEEYPYCQRILTIHWSIRCRDVGDRHTFYASRLRRWD